MQIIVTPASFNVASGPLPNILIGGSGLAGLVVNGTTLSGYVPITGAGSATAYISGNVLVVSGSSTGTLTGAFASLYSSNTFTGTGQNFASIVNILPVYTTGQYQTQQIPSGYATLLMMSGVPTLVKFNNYTSLCNNNAQIFLHNIYTQGAPNSGEFNYLTQLSATNSSGANSFVTCDGTNDGVVTLGTKPNMTTLTVSGGNVGIGTQSPQIPLDTTQVGNGTPSGAFYITTANTYVPQGGPGPYPAPNIYIRPGQGFTSPGGSIVLDAGSDSLGYNSQSNIYLNCFPSTNPPGNVGIGNQSPIYTLDVSGSGNFSNGLYVSGNSVVTTNHLIAGNDISISGSGNYLVISYVGPLLLYGSGSPSGVVSAPVGSIYSDTGNHIQYNKFGGGNSTTGWY